MNYDANLFDSLELNEQNSTNGGGLFGALILIFDIISISYAVNKCKGIYNEAFDTGFEVGIAETKKLLGVD